ncbi:MAG: hypothetical protein QG599_254 [Pseudomonadota bacterium]|nr:hypothetical protein [Pseudomonadota bacterium]
MRRLIIFDGAIKRLLRSKANFAADSDTDIGTDDAVY